MKVKKIRKEGDEMFELKSDFKPAGDQPTAIAELVKRNSGGQKRTGFVRCNWYRKNFYDC